MDCAEIRDAFTRGEVLSNALVQAHLAVCPHCRELFESDAELGRSLASEAVLPMPFPEELFNQLETRVAGETGLRAWLRSRPTSQRFLVVALSVLVVVGVGGVVNRRPDFAGYPSARLTLLLGIYLLGILVAFGKELFLYVRRSALGDYFGLVVAALALPFVIAFAPATDASLAFGPDGALGCFSYGALLTLPTAALLWAFDRDDRLSTRTVCLSAAALGLSANLILELHCPNGNLRHVLLGHASLGVAWLAAWLLTRRLTSTAGYLRK
jgi:hypothetical protein